jgi:hypothetical protein
MLSDSSGWGEARSYTEGRAVVLDVLRLRVRPWGIRVVATTIARGYDAQQIRAGVEKREVLARGAAEELADARRPEPC